MALYRPIPFVQHLLQKHLSPNAYVIDATVGNGNDTLFIAQLLNQHGKIWGFDIQQTAITNTTNRLKEQNIACSIELFQQSHAALLQRLEQYIGKIDAVIFNLGYLPHHDESVTTMLSSTYQAILQATALLKIRGLLIIVAYPGHKHGMIEYKALQQLFAKANNNFYYASNYQQINGTNNPPSVFVIEKRS